MTVISTNMTRDSMWCSRRPFFELIVGCLGSTIQKQIIQLKYTVKDGIAIQSSSGRVAEAYAVGVRRTHVFGREPLAHKR